MLKNKLEAILFASNKPLGVEDLARLCKEEVSNIQSALDEIRSELKSRNSSLVLVENNGFFRIVVHESFIPYVKKLVTKTELPKSVVETLAVVAYKAPVMQSGVIKIRTNKGYDHLASLEKEGFITREKKGRSKLIKLTSRFFEYFDIPPDKLKERLSKLDDVAPLEKDTVGSLDVYERPVPEGEEVKAMVDGMEAYGAVVKHKPKVVESASAVASVEVSSVPDILKPIPEPPKLKIKTAAEEAKEVAAVIEGKPLKGKGLYEGEIPEQIKPRVADKVREMLGGNGEVQEDNNK